MEPVLGNIVVWSNLHAIGTRGCMRIGELEIEDGTTALC